MPVLPRQAVYSINRPLPYEVKDNWLVPPVMVGLFAKKPIGLGNTQLLNSIFTTLSRAYDWLVTQYSMLTPIPPAPPHAFTGKPGKIIPDYRYNAPGNYIQTRIF